MQIHMCFCVCVCVHQIPACSFLLFSLEPLNFSQCKGTEILLALTSIRASQNKQAYWMSAFPIPDSKNSLSQNSSPTLPSMEQEPFLSCKVQGPKSDFLGGEDSFLFAKGNWGACICHADPSRTLARSSMPIHYADLLIQTLAWGCLEPKAGNQIYSKELLRPAKMNQGLFY